MRPLNLVIAVSLAALCTAPAFADTITIEQAHKVVDAEIDLVTKYYVFPEKRAGIVSDIRGALVQNADSYRALRHFTISLAVACTVLTALVAFGWSFVTGLFFLGLYFAIVP